MSLSSGRYAQMLGLPVGLGSRGRSTTSSPSCVKMRARQEEKRMSIQIN